MDWRQIANGWKQLVAKAFFRVALCRRSTPEADRRKLAAPLRQG